ncbi:hypothetical protein ACSBR2_014926 [Camellia fascicularis]
MALMSRPYAYSKMEREDPEEIKHRRAQFLIYKALEKVDSQRRPSWLRVRICKLKIKIGKRLKRLRKSMLLSMSRAKNGVCKQVICQWKTWKRLFRSGGQAMVNLPPVFA